MKKPSGYALVTPAGNIVAETFNVDKECAESAAYDYLSATKPWAKSPKFWKRWDEFVAERERRRWYVEKVALVLW